MTNLSVQPWPAILDTSSCNLIQDFFVPALAASLRYDRGVGYFSSGWLWVATEGMAALARNSGWARWVISPILSEEDWQALQQGEAVHYDEVLPRNALCPRLAGGRCHSEFRTGLAAQQTRTLRVS